MSKTKIKDILGYDFLSNLDISKDGEKLAYIKTKANYDHNKYESDLWIYNTKKAETFPITDNKNISIFTFNQDSNLVYKAKSDDKKDTFYIYNGYGIGKKIFDIDLEVKSIKFLKDDLYLINASNKKDEKAKKKEEENKYFEKLDTLPFWLNSQGYLKKEETSYYFYKANDGKLVKIIDSKFPNEIYRLSLNEDLSKVIFIKANYDKNNVADTRESLVLFDIKTKTEKVLIDSLFSFYTAEFLSDKIIFVGSDMKKGGINQDSFIYTCDFDGNYKKITDDDFDMSFGNSLGTDARYGSNKDFFKANDRLYFIVTEKETTKLYSTDINGELKLEIDEQVEDFIINNNDIYYLSMSENSLSELKKKNKDVILVENKVDSKLGKIETFYFESNGDTLKGFVLLPPKFNKNKKYPVILSIHGGPKTEFGSIFHHEHQVLASNDYIVIYTNPHGSSGNGVEFSDIRGKYGDIDYDDLMRFVDLAIEKYPQIDSGNLGVYGGSYGGFMTNWIIGHNDRFKAACSQRSISNWTSFYGVSDIGYYFGYDQITATPWNSLDKMWDQSPIKYADKVKTPTLYIHSDEDYRCPLEQGLQMYTKLKLNGVDTKMFVFHGENHELSRSGKPHSRIKRLKEIKKWFDGHLK
ncbi:MAG: S9 family peptidase [Anaerococcus sp.]|uniref:alpha/beta hydrolase family protein n=1 Tax=Anaerococcus sp. TaxID=1872515 RepID=UPI0029087B09|nr:S9 family peptidase [Anaerococcus sp.]MDU4025576.1 S9 family peptidase [Anaerococcus sp.]